MFEDSNCNLDGAIVIFGCIFLFIVATAVLLLLM